jgi:hypothetical protein
VSQETICDCEERRVISSRRKQRQDAQGRY